MRCTFFSSCTVNILCYELHWHSGHIMDLSIFSFSPDMPLLYTLRQRGIRSQILLERFLSYLLIRLLHCEFSIFIELCSCIVFHVYCCRCEYVSEFEFSSHLVYVIIWNIYRVSFRFCEAWSEKFSLLIIKCFQNCLCVFPDDYRGILSATIWFLVWIKNIKSKLRLWKQPIKSHMLTPSI